MAFQQSLNVNAQGSNFWDLGGGQVINNIGQIVQANTNTVPLPDPSYKLMPLSSRTFIGRREYLERLEQYFGQEVDQSPRRKQFLLYGMGGIGKSQISIKFVERNTDR